MLKKEEPSWEKEISLTREVITRINSMNPKPKFFVICGDMLDAFPYAEWPESQENYRCGTQELREEQYKDFVKVFQELCPEVKLICICGNHDIGDVPSADTLKVYKAQFGQDYFSFWAGGVKFVVLNSQYIYVPDAMPEQTEKQLKFIETVKDPSAKYTGKNNFPRNRLGPCPL